MKVQQYIRLPHAGLYSYNGRQIELCQIKLWTGFWTD